MPKSVSIDILRTPRRSIALLVVGLPLLCGFFLRFYKIEEIGLSGSDTVYYTNLARAWAEGEPTYQIERQVHVYRPVSLFLFAAGIQLWGFEDASIKKINALLDTANLLLIFLLCHLLSAGNLWLSAMATTVYAALPMALRMARQELVHTSSSFMVLITAFLLVLADRESLPWRRRLLLALCGLFSGFAALTHEELIFVGLGCVLFLAGRAVLRIDRRGVEVMLLEAPIVLASLLITVRGLLSRHNEFLGKKGELIEGLDYPAGAALAQKAAAFAERAFRYLWNGVVGNGSAWLLGMFLLALIVAFAGVVRWSMDRRRFASKRGSLLYLPIVLIGAYTIGYAWFFRYYTSRLYLPLIPLVIVVAFLWIDRLRAAWGARARRSLPFFLAAVLLLFNLESHRHLTTYLSVRKTPERYVIPGIGDFDLSAGYRALLESSYSKSWWRRSYDELKGKVSRRARLLVTPSILDPAPGRRIFQMDFYFGDHAIYAIDHDEPFAELIERYDIRYVLFAQKNLIWRFVNMRRFQRYEYRGRWRRGAKLDLGGSCSLSPEEYSVEAEFRCLREAIRPSDARVVYLDGRSGTDLVLPADRLPQLVIFELESKPRTEDSHDLERSGLAPSPAGSAGRSGR